MRGAGISTRGTSPPVPNSSTPKRPRDSSRHAGQEARHRGPAKIWIVVARPGKVPSDLQAELRAGTDGECRLAGGLHRLDGQSFRHTHDPAGNRSISAAFSWRASPVFCSPAARAPPAPEVEYNGCRTVSFPGPVCALWPKPRSALLKLWVRADPGTEVEIRADGERLDVARRRVTRRPPVQLPLSIPEHLPSAHSPAAPAGRGTQSTWSLQPCVTRPQWQGEVSALSRNPRIPAT